MTEAAFPLLGAAFVVLIILPALALLTKGGLVLLERKHVGHGLNLRYLLITSSSVLPLAWLLSAGLHQAESGETALACLINHDTAARCFESGFFALTLGLVMLASTLTTLGGLRGVRDSRSDAGVVLLARINALLTAHPSLSLLRGRIGVTDQVGFALATHGLLSPRVVVSTAYGANLSDHMLASALGHEREHVRSLDPLRFFVLRLALALNPFGRFLLEPHAARWQAAREAHCDREAVIHGAAPLPLADAIVRAARPSVRESVALGARDTAILEFRVGMLIAFAERPPERCCHRGPSAFPVACGLLLIVLFLPHQTGTAGLDLLHAGAEHAFTLFWR